MKHHSLVALAPIYRLYFWQVAVLLGLVLSAGCGHRPPPPLPPPAPSPGPVPSSDAGSSDTLNAPLPELVVEIEPSRIQKGESALMTWQTRHATQVVIDPNIGVVDPSGRIKFFPEQSTSYTVTALGPGGKVERTVSVEVVDRLNLTPQPLEETDLPPEQRFATFVKPVFFEFDSAELGPEAQLTLDGNIRWLNQPENRHLEFLIEGHCDSRGTEEYNLALGDKRAQVVKDYLVRKGIDPGRIRTISLGEERPFDPRPTEEAWALNRRAHFVLLPKP